ncbi:MAG: DUF1178 family protein [Pseudomonadota bacterium]
MIKYALKCSKGHQFESWFKDSAAFESLSKAKQISCAICGATKVEKTIMAPAVSGVKKSNAADDAPLSQPSSPAEAALKEMRDHLRKNSDYVGTEFAAEARRIHDGESDQRSIWGEATKEDAKSLKDDGIPVAPLPWMSRQDD